MYVCVCTRRLCISCVSGYESFLSPSQSAFVCAWVRACVCVCVCVCMYVCIYICMYVYVCMYVYGSVSEKIKSGYIYKKL